MTDITRFKNVSLSKKTYSDVGVLSKEIFDVPLSLSKTIEYLVDKEIKKVKKKRKQSPMDQLKPKKVICPNCKGNGYVKLTTENAKQRASSSMYGL